MAPVSPAASSLPAPEGSWSLFPDTSWLLGSAQTFSQDGLGFYRRCEQIGGIVETRLLWKHVYVVTDPVAIADILVNYPRSFTKPYLLRRMKVIFGNGLLTAEGDEWLHNRRLVQPAFQSERMPGFIDFVRENTEALAAAWHPAQVRDVYPDLIDLCLHNLARTMFGVYDAEVQALVRAVVENCQAVMHALSNITRVSPLLYPSR